MTTQANSVLQFPTPSRQQLLTKAFELITRAETILDELDRQSKADINAILTRVNARLQETASGPTWQEWVSVRQHLEQLEAGHTLKKGIAPHNADRIMTALGRPAGLDEVRTLLLEHLRDCSTFGHKKLAAVKRYQSIQGCCTAEAHEACDAMLTALCA